VEVDVGERVLVAVKVLVLVNVLVLVKVAVQVLPGYPQGVFEGAGVGVGAGDVGLPQPVILKMEVIVPITNRAKRTWAVFTNSSPKKLNNKFLY
jgi:hypothetical protein